MRTLTLQQGSKEWHQHRASHNNASDAPAMIGVSKYKKRGDLVREKATGITPEIDAATQRIFDDGHRFESLARPLAEEIVGEELFPCVGVADDSNLSASFDGLTMLGDVAFEHKTLNDTLRAAMQDGCTGADLPEHYRVQMEQQLMVSGADKVLFMASKWDGSDLVEERHCWYESDLDMRAKIVAGWDQFAADVAAYEPEPGTARVNAGVTPVTLPALHVETTGKVIASNLDAYREHAMQVLGSINRELTTDQDFADAESTVKWCKQVESKLSAAKDSVLGQMATVDEVCRTIDDLSAETRRVRLDLDKLVKAEKESRKREIVTHYVELVRKHYAVMAASMGEHAIGAPATLQADIAGAIKGLKTLGSITDAADTAAANLKIDASQQADRIRAAVAVMDEFADQSHLFADRVQLCATKSPEDLRNLAKARIAEHEERERQRAETVREQIRAEEQAKAKRDAEAREHAEAQKRAAEQREQVTPQAPAPEPKASPAADYADDLAEVWPDDSEPVKLLKLGQINASIAPLSITAAGLSELGIRPTTTKGASKLYSSRDLPELYAALLRVINKARDNYRLGDKETQS